MYIRLYYSVKSNQRLHNFIATFSSLPPPKNKDFRGIARTCDVMMSVTSQENSPVGAPEIFFYYISIRFFKNDRFIIGYLQVITFFLFFKLLFECCFDSLGQFVH